MNSSIRIWLFGLMIIATWIIVRFAICLSACCATDGTPVNNPQYDGGCEGGDAVTKETCEALAKDIGKGATWEYYPDGKCVDEKCTVGTKGGLGAHKISVKRSYPGVTQAPFFNTGTDSNCGGRFFAIHNYPANLPKPPLPLIGQVDSVGDPIGTLQTIEVSNLDLIAAAMQFYQDSGFVSPGDTIYIYAFGDGNAEGSFPGTFCYGTDEYYGMIPPGDSTIFFEGRMVVSTWYGSDTTSIPTTVGFIGVVHMGLIADAIPTLSEWGLIIFSLLLLATLVFYISRKRKLATPAAFGIFLFAFTIAFYLSSRL